MKTDKTEKKPAHTPGPWSAEGTVVWAYPEPGLASQICEMKGIGRIYKGENHLNADARLIAAAPEMLTVLKAVRSQLHESDQELIDAVLAKVQGN